MPDLGAHLCFQGGGGPAFLGGSLRQRRQHDLVARGHDINDAPVMPNISQRRARDLNNAVVVPARGTPRQQKRVYARLRRAMRGNDRTRDLIPEASPTLRAPLQAAAVRVAFPAECW